jgi:signal transduction histidine kinase
VFRVVDEALTNVVRHAAATHCRIVISADDVLRVEVRDDGVGLVTPRAGGVGLQSMKQRAERLGGQCVARAEGRGTSVLLEIPLVRS